MAGRDRARVTKVPSECKVLVEGASDANTLALPTPAISSLPNCVALATPLRNMQMTTTSRFRPASSRLTV
jgi:hypothetical protein